MNGCSFFHRVTRVNMDYHHPHHYHHHYHHFISQSLSLTRSHTLVDVSVFSHSLTYTLTFPLHGRLSQGKEHRTLFIILFMGRGSMVRLISITVYALSFIVLFSLLESRPTHLLALIENWNRERKQKQVLRPINMTCRAWGREYVNMCNEAAHLANWSVTDSSKQKT